MIPLLLLAFGALGAEPIGAMGSTLDLPSGWKREALSPTVGRDQFHSANGLFVVVRELRGPFYEDNDLLRQLRSVAIGIENRGGKANGDVRYGDRAGVRFVEQYYDATIGGQDIAYDLQVVGQGALGYLVMSWSQADRRLPLHRAARQLRAGITFPGEQSEWARLSKPLDAESTVVGHTVRYAYPPAVFAPVSGKALGSAFAGVQAPGEQTSLFLLALRSESDTDGVLDGALEVLAGLGQEVEAKPHEDVTIDGRHGRIAYEEGTAADGPFSAAAAVVELEDGVFLDLRFLAYGSLAARRHLWDAFLASVKVEDEPVVDAFPAPTPTPSKRALTPQQAGLLGAATSLGAVSHGDAMRLVGDDLYVQAYRGVKRRSVADGADPAESDVAVPTEGKTQLPVPRPDGLYVPSTSGDVFRLLDEKTAESAGFSATLLADAGDRGLLLVRDAPGVSVAGYGVIDATGGRRLFLRDAKGEEKLLKELRGGVEQAAVRGSDALLAVDPDGDGYAWGARSLVAVSLDDGATKPLGEWTALTCIAADAEGWLVTGTPEGAPSGVWRVSRTGERALLLSGDHQAAFPQADGGLLLATRWHPADVEADRYGLVALRVPGAAVKEFGPRFAPLTAAYVQDVAVAALASLGLSAEPTRVLTDPGSLRRFVDAASRVSEKGVGVPLPRDADAIDDLLDRAAGEPHLLTEGYLLLTALLCDDLLKDGAVWATGRPPSGLAIFGGAGEPENDHAAGFLPLEVVRSTLRDSEGWYSPAKGIRDRLDGRLLVLGVDEDAVRARVEAARRPGMDDLAKWPNAQVITWLSAERTNARLRGVAYEKLAAAGRVADLAEIAAPFLDPAKPAYADLQASLAGRVAKNAGAEADAALVTDLRAAIAAWSDRAELYVLLGSVYERGTSPDRARLAAACYRHVAENLKWSSSADQAREGLERVTGTKAE